MAGVDHNYHPQLAPTGRPAILTAAGLCRRADANVLLNDVSVSIQGGDRIAIVGPTGSGKTLLLRSLAMLDPLDGGEIRWNGTGIRGDDIPAFRSHVIYLHQRPALVEGTVEDNLRHPFSLGVHKQDQFRRDRIVELLVTLGREESFLKKQQRDLSGGESQLTALLRAIQLEPNILLLDEPTAALDSEATTMVEALVTRWLDEMPTTRAMVWVTHNHEQSRRVSTSILKIREGKLS